MMQVLCKILARFQRYAALAARFPVYVRDRFLKRPGSTPRSVLYVIEDGNWSIKWDGIHTTRELRTLGRQADVAVSPVFTAGKILHFGSSYAFETQGFKLASRTNKVVVTFFHGRYGDDPLIDRRFEKVLNNIHRIDAVAVSNSIMRARFIELGVPEDKIFLVPVGVDPDVFRPLSMEEKHTRRTALGIPQDAFVVGSFQKDGQGWGEGLDPKLIKGPDVFLEAVSKFNTKRNVFVLLSGPARGYVKQGLEKAGIAYRHDFFENPDEVAGLYPLLDAYAVTSREEGGPKAIIEALACGLPLVTSDVGMARDVLEGRDCGIICPVEDARAMAEAMERIATDDALRMRFARNGPERARDYSWANIARACEVLYKAIET